MTPEELEEMRGYANQWAGEGSDWRILRLCDALEASQAEAKKWEARALENYGIAYGNEEWEKLKQEWEAERQAHAETVRVLRELVDGGTLCADDQGVSCLFCDGATSFERYDGYPHEPDCRWVAAEARLAALEAERQEHARTRQGRR